MNADINPAATRRTFNLAKLMIGVARHFDLDYYTASLTLIGALQRLPTVEILAPRSIRAGPRFDAGDSDHSSVVFADEVDRAWLLGYLDALCVPSKDGSGGTAPQDIPPWLDSCYLWAADVMRVAQEAGADDPVSVIEMEYDDRAAARAMASDWTVSYIGEDVNHYESGAPGDSLFDEHGAIVPGVAKARCKMPHDETRYNDAGLLQCLDAVLSRKAPGRPKAARMELAAALGVSLEALKKAVGRARDRVVTG